MIPFNVPPYIGKEDKYIKQAIDSRKICGDGQFTKKCNVKFEEMTGAKKVLMTTSGTSALEMAALLTDIKPGDEAVMPSYTFVSTANAFVLRGATIVFVDIRPDTMNIDENLIEDAITEKQRLLFLFISVAFGDFGCYSFHETKNYSMGEGGAVLVNHEKNVERAEIIREKGTNRTKFFRGQVDKYTWVDLGSSYLQSELNCAYLYAQIENPDIINNDRLQSWNTYYELLTPLKEKGCIDLPVVPAGCVHNAHMFYIKTKDLEERSRLIAFLKENGIGAVFHYIPLHSSPAGQQFSRFHGEDKYTTKESERLLRLPMYYGLEKKDI